MGFVFRCGTSWRRGGEKKVALKSGGRRRTQKPHEKTIGTSNIYNMISHDSLNLSWQEKRRLTACVSVSLAVVVFAGRRERGRGRSEMVIKAEMAPREIGWEDKGQRYG